MLGKLLLIIALLVCVMFTLQPANAGTPRYGVLLGTFSGKLRGVEAWRKGQADKDLTGVSLVLAKEKNVYEQRPGYVLMAGPFAFASKAQQLARRLERSGRLVRTAKWPEPAAMVVVSGSKPAARKTCRLPVAPPDPEKDQDRMRRSLAAMETEGGSKFNSDLYYDDDTSQVGNATSMESPNGKVANKLYTEVASGGDLNLSVRGKALAETPVGRSKIRGVVDYSVNQIGSERLAVSHVWQPDDALETEVGLASEVGGNPERNVFGSVSKKIADGVRLTQRMDVYERGEIKTFSGIGITF